MNTIEAAPHASASVAKGIARFAKAIAQLAGRVVSNNNSSEFSVDCFVLNDDAIARNDEALVINDEGFVHY